MSQSPVAVQSNNIKPIVLNVSKKILNRESIFRQPSNLPNDELKKTSKLTETEILNSRIYCRLQYRLEELQNGMQQQQIEHVKNMKIMDKLIGMGKDKVHSLKYEVWELRNSILELDQLLNEELEENEQMQNEFRIGEYQEEGEGLNFGDNDDEDEDEDQENDDSEIQNIESGMESGSNIGCSIQNLIPHVFLEGSMKSIKENSLNQW